MATKESLELTESIDGRRYYNIVKDGKRYKLPSVTTVIGAMTDHTAIDEWRKRVGDEEADRISKFSANRGTCMHQKLEYWFTSDIEDKGKRLADVNQKMLGFVKENGYTKEELDCGNGLFNSLMWCGFFERVGEVVSMEDTLYSLTCGGYAGRCDFIMKNLEGEYVLVDFKTARRRKRKEWILNYYLQLGAYFVAYYQLTHIKVHHAELWISVEQDIPQLVYISEEELIENAKAFLRLCKQYHEQYDYLLLEGKKF